MTLPHAPDWRDIGDVPRSTYAAQLRGTPLERYANSLYDAAQPHTALCLAHMWAESQYETDRLLLSPSDHNPLNLRPGPGAIGATGDKAGYLTFDHPADCVIEWKRRISDPTYKANAFPGGAYTSTTTLDEYLARYAPKGDVHEIPGVDNADMDYPGIVRTMLARFAAMEDTGMALGVKKQMIPATNRNYPHLLIDENGDLWIIVHETGNTGAGTGARMHADFLRNGGGSSGVAFHFAVDQIEAYQMLRLNRVGWHASDGCNSRADDWGCFRGIAIETCVNDGNRYKTQTRRNLAELIVKIISGSPDIDYGGVDYRRFSADRIRTHNDTAFDKKWCPTYMLNDGYIPTLRTQVRSGLSGITPAPISGIAMGDTVEATAALNVRKGWGLKHPVTVTLTPGMRATVIVDDADAFARTHDGYTWLNIRGDFGTGWAAADWLQKVVVAPPPKPVEYAPRVVIPELAALTVADRDTAVKMVLKNGIHFITVWDEVEAVEDATNLQFAYKGAKKTEADSPKGTRRWVSHLFQADDKRWYYYDERANRLIADQWKRVTDAPDVDALLAALTTSLENAVA